MKTLRHALIAFAGSIVPLASLAAVVNCGGDDSSTSASDASPPEGEETSADAGPAMDARATVDVAVVDAASPGHDATTPLMDSGTTTPPMDSGTTTPLMDSGTTTPPMDSGAVITPDATLSDAGVNHDAGNADAAATHDAGAGDATLPTAIEDAGPDGNRDSAVAITDGGNDALAPIFLFPGQVAAALCDQIANCCFGTDAAAFDRQHCLGNEGEVGFAQSNLGTDLLSGGHVAFDSVKAAACLTDIGQIDCSQGGTGQITSAQSAALYTDCFAALTGTLAEGTSCRGSIECQPGLFCGPATTAADGGDAGTQTCQPLRIANQSCNDFGNALTNDNVANSQTECSYRGSGNTGVSCQYEDRATHAPLYDGGWYCAASETNGSSCNTELDCNSTVCNSRQCTTAQTFAPAATCTAFTLVDAGDGG